MRRLSLNYPSYLLIILAWIHQLTKSSDSQNGIARSAFDVDESIDESEFLLGFCHSTGFLVMLRLHLFFLSPLLNAGRVDTGAASDLSLHCVGRALQ